MRGDRAAERLTIQMLHEIGDQEIRRGESLKRLGTYTLSVSNYRQSLEQILFW